MRKIGKDLLAPKKTSLLVIRQEVGGANINYHDDCRKNHSITVVPGSNV